MRKGKYGIKLELMIEMRYKIFAGISLKAFFKLPFLSKVSSRELRACRF